MGKWFQTVGIGKAMSITSIETLSWGGWKSWGSLGVLHNCIWDVKVHLVYSFQKQTPTVLCTFTPPPPPARCARAPMHAFLSQVFSLDVEARDLSKVVPTPPTT